MDLTIEMEFLIHTRSKAGVHPNSLPPGWICPRISKLNGFAVGVSVHLMVSLSVSDQKTSVPLETSQSPLHPLPQPIPEWTGMSPLLPQYRLLHPSMVLGSEMISEHENAMASSFGAELLMGSQA